MEIDLHLQPIQRVVVPETSLVDPWNPWRHSVILSYIRIWKKYERNCGFYFSKKQTTTDLSLNPFVYITIIDEYLCGGGIRWLHHMYDVIIRSPSLNASHHTQTMEYLAGWKWVFLISYLCRCIYDVYYTLCNVQCTVYIVHPTLYIYNVV